jgi:hypothetical protein
VASRGEQSEEREGDFGGASGETRHEDVRLEVVHPHERLLVLDRQRLGSLAPHAQADLQPRPDCDGDRIHICCRGQASSSECLGDDAVQGLGVRVACQSGHHSTPLFVNLAL